MLTKPITSVALVVASLAVAVLVPRALAQAPAAPAAPAAGPAPMSPGTQTKLYGEIQTAIKDKNFDIALAKTKEILGSPGPKKDLMYEELFFYVGLFNLEKGQNPEAEAGFRECLKQFPKAEFPKAEFTTRCHLGAGRACMLQDTPAKKQQAIAELNLAAKDPKIRSEAGLWLGQVYIDLKQYEDALKVFRSLMGADVRTPQQTTAAIEVIGLLADAGKLEDLSSYLDQLSRQSGVRDALAWYVTQVLMRGDELLGMDNPNAYEAALIIYNSVPPRSEIMEVQALALVSMRKDVATLEANVRDEANKPMNQRSRAAELLANLKPAIEVVEKAKKFIDEKTDLDAAILMRRGRCLYNLKRYDEALLCFRTIRLKYAGMPDAEHAGYAEILVLSKQQNIPEIKEKCDLFLTKYPDSESAERVATLAGQVLVQSGNWKEVSSFYRGLESRFPKSESMEQFVFYQAFAFFMEGNWKEAAPILTRFLKTYPQSPQVESAMYFVAMANFLNNKYKESLASINDYLKLFPDGKYAGDMHYRLAFIESNDKEVDQSDRIIRELTSFLQDHPDDAANGSLLCLLADTYKKLKAKTDQEAAANEEAALDAYKKAVETNSPDDIMQYALDSATSLMQKKKDWEGIAEMHGTFVKRRPDSQLALLSIAQVAKMKARQGKAAEAAEILSNAIKTRITNPASEQVEYVLDQIVTSLVPRKKTKDIDAKALEDQLVDILTKVIGEQKNPTTNARLYYARARLYQALKDTKKSDLYLKGIATTNAKTPEVLSPALLSVCGDILLKIGDLEGAEAMFRRLADRYKESMFSDAGPVGLGYIALARKHYEEAMKIFDNALDNNPGMSHIKEATLGKLQALVELNKFDDAEKLGLKLVGDKSFRGEPSAQAYMLIASCYRKQAAKTTGAEAAEWLKKAHAIYQRVYLITGALPDICAEAYWQAYECLKALGESEIATKTLKELSTNPKLQNTKRATDAAALVK